MKKTLAILIATFAMNAASVARADVIVDHSDRGAFNALNLTGDWKITGGSYQIRAINNGGTPVDFSHNYTVFDLSGLSGTVSGATIRYYSPSDGWDSTAASETVGLFDVSTSPAELALGDAGANPSSVFADLGAGLNYGSVAFTGADVSTYVTSAPLSADALLAINAAIGSGKWSVGGALTSIDGSFGSAYERVLKSTGVGTPSTQLILTGSVVPEPSSLALMALTSVVGLVGRRRANRS